MPEPAIAHKAYDTIETKFGKTQIRETTNSRAMIKAIKEAKAQMKLKDKWRVDDTHAKADYDNDRKFITRGGGSSFAITKDGDIISVAPNKRP